MKERETYSKQDFLNDAEICGIDPALTEAVWQRMVLESVLVELEFKPKMEDLIDEDFGIHNEDIRDLVTELAIQCGKVPEEWNIIDVERLVTVKDIILYLNDLPNN